RDLEQIQADAARGRASVVAKRAEARALAGAARASLEQGDLERALSALSRAETIDQNLAPQLAEPAGALAARVALEYAQAGRFVEAVAFFERCRSRAPELEPDIRDALATCRVHVSLELLLQGHEERAFRTLRLVRSEAPDHALGRYYLGALAELDRDHATAEAHYRRALTALEVRAPDARTAADLRGALERAINHLPITLETLASQRRFDEVLARLPERARSESFVVYANGADLARSVLAAAERSARAVDAWSKRPSPKEPVQVYVFDRETTLQNLPGNSLHVRGVTQVFGRRGVLVRRILTAADVAGLEDEVMPHEVGHALVGSDPDYALPLWLNEGVSMLEERDGALAARIRRYATSRKQGEGLPIAQIVRLPGYPESSSAATSFYDGSAALAAHLMDEHGRAAVLDAFRSDERSLEERLRLFRLAPETAEQAVLRWVQSRR
ncbi:MAG: tetratricopeptide repeat protein, partial [Planctomycetota bacterium]